MGPIGAEKTYVLKVGMRRVSPMLFSFRSADQAASGLILGSPKVLPEEARRPLGEEAARFALVSARDYIFVLTRKTPL